jgi:antitoxin ParD1/3/4
LLPKQAKPAHKAVMRTSKPITDHKEAILGEALRARITASIDDPRPSRPAGDVFKPLRARHAGRMKS